MFLFVSGNVEKLSEVGDLKLIADFNWQTQKSVLSYETSGKICFFSRISLYI